MKSISSITDPGILGTALPDVSLPATDGRTVSPRDFIGRTLLAVYPWTGRPGRPNPPGWDDIPGAHGSTPELEGFRDLFAHFERQAMQIFGLSLQSTDYQRELVDRLRLPFPILSDANHVFADAVGLPRFSTGGSSYLEKLSIAAKDGQVERVFYPVPDPAGHAAEVLRWLEEAL